MRSDASTRRVAAATLSLSVFVAAFAALLIGSVATGASAQSDPGDSSAKTNKLKTKNLTISPKTLAFGNLSPHESSAPETVTIHNPNSMTIEVSSIESSDSEFVPSTNCVGPISANSDCVVSVVFTPSSAGKKSAKLNIVNAASKKALAVGMVGEGNGAPAPTPTATATPTATPTATSTPQPCPSPGAGACVAGPAAITQLLPSSAVAGDPSVPLAVCGCNLTASTAVQWNGAGRTTSFISANQVNASIPAGDIANIGVDQVTVLANSVVSAPETFFVGKTGGAGFAEVAINQESTDIVNDPVNRVIYLSVSGAAPTNGNTISVLNLASGQITTSPFAGSNPDVLAISDDSQFLYAGIDGAAKVQRFALPSLTTDISYSLGSSGFSGPYFALDLQVAPGAPHTTAVTRAVMNSSPAAQGGIVIFDDSTARPTIAKGFGPGGGGGVLYDSLQWGSDDTALYAANNEDTGFDFYTLMVNAGGITLANDYPSDFSAFNKRIHFDSGSKLVYSDGGQAIDPSTGNPVGSYSPSSFGVMVPDSTLNKAFFVGDSGSIQSFKLNQFSLITSITIPSFAGSPLRIIRWGNNGLAINTFQGPVYLIGGNFVH